jgi:hypothetical protein
MPDISALEEMKKSPPIRLAAGDRLTAQVDSVLISERNHKAFVKLMLAFIEYIPFVLKAAEGGLQLLLDSPLVGKDEEKEVREMMEAYKTAIRILALLAMRTFISNCGLWCCFSGF